MITEVLSSFAGPFGTPLEIIKQSFYCSSKKPTQSISFITGLHGDELEGMYLCSTLMNYLKSLTKKNPSAFLGDIHVYPVVNPLGAHHLSRLWPQHEIDINRTFGETEDFSIVSRTADILLQDVIRHSDIAIDIHSSNQHLRELPQIRILEEFEKQVLPFALNSGVSLIWIHPYADLFESTLGYQLNRQKIPTLVIETGIGLRVTKSLSDLILPGLIRFLCSIDVLNQDLIDEAEPEFSPPVFRLDDVKQVQSKNPGLFVADVEIGQKVRQSDTIGQVLNPIDGSQLETITAPANGRVFTLRESPIVHSGSLIARSAHF